MAETVETPKPEVPKPTFTFKGDQFTSLRLMVSEQCAKNIVGMGGTNLQRIRDRIDGAINVDGDAGKVATITFQSLKSHILWAFGEIARLLETPPYPPTARSNHEVIINVLIPENISGYLIGKSGVVIRNLSRQYAVFSKVCSELMPGSSEKLLIIAGRYQNIDGFMEHLLNFYYNYPVELSNVRMFNPYGNWTLPPPENFYQKDANLMQNQYAQGEGAQSYSSSMHGYQPSMMVSNYHVMHQPMYQQSSYQKPVVSMPSQAYQQVSVASQGGYSEVPMGSASGVDVSQIQDYSQYAQSYQQGSDYYVDPYAYTRQQYASQQVASTTDAYSTQQSVRPSTSAAATQYQYTQ